jgi:hypothetical protein
MTPRDAWPQWGAAWVKRKGHIHTGKHHPRGTLWGRAFVLNPNKPVIPAEHRPLSEGLRQARSALRGICRALGVGL